MKYIINAFRGFCMALADSVPGVSGGTIAFILGFYDRFINSLNDLIYGDWDKKKSAISFLFKVGIGWAIGIILASIVLTSLFESNIYKISSLFIGFIIFSIPVIMKEECDNLKGKYYNMIFTILGIGIVSLITYFNPISNNVNTINVADLNIGLALYIAFSGMIAISAMILPGISGSTLLLIFGLYIPLMGAIKEVLNFNFNYLPALIALGVGIIIGVVLVIKIIKICLEKYRSSTIYFILGLMIGSIYAIIMGPTTLDVPHEALNLKTFSIIFFAVGGFIILALERVKKVIAQKHIEE